MENNHVQVAQGFRILLGAFAPYIARELGNEFGKDWCDAAESGLLDFRSAKNGMWNNQNLADLASVEAMEESRDEFVRFYSWRIEEMQSHAPNDGHYILGNWEKEGLIEGIITQNVENYHVRAGSKKIAQLHGDLGTIRCKDCDSQYDSVQYLSSKSPTTCQQCGGILRPNVVLFGELLPNRAINLANEMMNDLELLIVLGSSLQVSPANQFPIMAKKQGARLVIINREPTPLDKIADLVVKHSIGEVLRHTNKCLAFRDDRMVF